MAVLKQLPEWAIIKGFKGSVDFYLWKGIPVARAWPRKAVPTQSAAELETWNFFRAMTQSWRDLAPEVILTLNSMVAGTSQRNFDLYQSMQYGHQTADLSVPPRPEEGDLGMIAIPISYSPSITPTTLAVNSTLYVTPVNLHFQIPFDLQQFNHYRLLCRAASNAAGQTIQVRVQETATANPLGNGNPDLTIPNVAAVYDSGDLLISSTPVIPTTYALGLKGSNATVDLAFLWATLYLWFE